jgi:molybdopterin-containing oxidoreductase family iron-sulfur binding subunit
MGRGDIIKETTLEIFNTKDAKVWNEVPMVSLNHEVEATKVDLWIHLIVLLDIILIFRLT